MKTYNVKDKKQMDGIYLLGIKFKNSQNLITDYDQDNEIQFKELIYYSYI